MAKNVENLLKRCLKRKIKITTAMVTAFMITGGIVYADGVLKKPGTYNEKYYIFTKTDEMKDGYAIPGEYKFENEEVTNIQFLGSKDWKKGFSVNDKDKMTTLKYKGKALFTTLSDLDSMLSSSGRTLGVEVSPELLLKNSKESNRTLLLNNSKKVKSGILASNGEVYVSGFDKIIIKKADEKNSNGKYDFGVKAEKGGRINLLATDEVTIKDSKTAVYTDGADSQINIYSDNINLTVSNEKDERKEGSHGVRVKNQGKTNLFAEGKITITGDKKNNKYFYKRSGILSELGGEVKLDSKEGITIDAYRGIDTKTGHVKAETKNGNITIKAEENGVYTGRLDNGNYKNGVELSAENGDITITSKKTGLTSINRTDVNKTETNLTANNITISATSGDGILSGGKSKVTLTAKEKISITGGETGLHSDEKFLDGNKKESSIKLAAKNAAISTLWVDSNAAIFAEKGSKIDLELEDELTVQSFAKGAGIKVEEGSEVTAKAKNKIDIKSSRNGIETSDKSEFLGTAKEINISSRKNAIENKLKSKVTLKGNDVSIFGDIITTGGSVTKIEKLSEEIGNVEIALNKDEIKNYREGKYYPSNYNWSLISSEENSNTDLDLKGENQAGNGSLLIGQVKDNIGTSLAGKVTLNMDKNSVWVPRKSNSVTNLNLNGGTIDLARDKESSIHIENLKGQGTFNVFVDTKHKSKGNMIYIQNFDSEGKKEISENKLNIQDIDLASLTKKEKIRFATLGQKAKDKVTFKGGVIEEKGIQNVGVKVLKENFDINDEENKNYTDKIFNDKYGFENYKNGENWYLTREENVKPNVPPTKPEVEKPNVPPTKPEIEKPNMPQAEPEMEKPNKPNRDNDITKAITEISKANYASAVYMDSLNERLGDISFAKGNDGIWVRLRNDRVGEDDEYRLRNYMTQLGYDQVYFTSNGEEHIGVAFDYTKGGMDYKNIDGKSNIDRYTASIYDTRLYNDGIYTDVVAKLGYMKSDFDITTSKQKYKVNGEYDNFIFGMSGEIGKKFMLNEKLYFEPQAQLQYTYVDKTDYTTNQGTKVQIDDINSLIGRVGFRIGHDFYSANKKDNTIYFKADINHEFLGEQHIKASDLTGSIDREYKNINTWVDLGFGISKDLTDNFNIYTDIEKQFGKEKDDNSWQMNLGFRYKFNEFSDIF